MFSSQVFLMHQSTTPYFLLITHHSLFTIHYSLLTSAWTSPTSLHPPSSAPRHLCCGQQGTATVRDAPPIPHSGCVHHRRHEIRKQPSTWFQSPCRQDQSCIWQSDR